MGVQAPRLGVGCVFPFLAGWWRAKPDDRAAERVGAGAVSAEQRRRSAPFGNGPFTDVGLGRGRSPAGSRRPNDYDPAATARGRALTRLASDVAFGEDRGIRGRAGDRPHLQGRSAWRPVPTNMRISTLLSRRLHRWEPEAAFAPIGSRDERIAWVHNWCPEPAPTLTFADDSRRDS